MCNHRLRFGTPVRTIRLDNARNVCAFKRWQTFGYIRWIRNDFGTIDWRLYVCRASGSGRITHIPGIEPGAELLLFVTGTEAMKRFLPRLDRLEKQAGGQLETIPASFWRRVANELTIKPRHPNPVPELEYLPC